MGRVAGIKSSARAIVHKHKAALLGQAVHNGIFQPGFGVLFHWLLRFLHLIRLQLQRRSLKNVMQQVQLLADFNGKRFGLYH